MKNIAAEALTTYGRLAVSERQLLECIGIPTDAAAELMVRADHLLAGIAKMTTNEIASIKGIGKSRATAIVAAIELGRRRQTESASSKHQISMSLDIYDILAPNMRDLTQEEFWIILLDRRNKVIKTLQIHRGGMTAMVIDPKVIFQKALEYKACAVILSHNHPSGAPSPSNEDIKLTDRMKQAGTIMDIKVLDHVIIGEGSYYSFADEGRI